MITPQVMGRAVRLLGLAIVASMSGCLGRTDPEWDDSPMQTDSLVYHLRKTEWGYDAWARATYTNKTNSPVYFERCMPGDEGPVYGLRRVTDQRTPMMMGIFWACVGGVPAGVIEPGESVVLRVWLGSADSPNADPPIRPEERIGIFRIFLLLFDRPTTNDEREDQLPEGDRRSNVFEVTFES